MKNLFLTLACGAALAGPVWAHSDDISFEEQLQEVRRLAASGRDLTPVLFQAVEFGEASQVIMLLAHVDVNATNCGGDTPCWDGRFPGTTPLMVAVKAGRADIAGLLLAAGADVDRKEHWGETALTMAAGIGRADITRMLIHRGATPEGRDATHLGLTVLMHAALGGNPEVLTELSAIPFLLNGPFGLNASERDGKTALMIAARSGHSGFVKRALLLGAYVDDRDSGGKTALMYAAGYGNADVSRLLLEYKADVNARNEIDLDTALTLAAQSCFFEGAAETIEVLLADPSTDVTARNREGKTALEYVESVTEKSCVQVKKVLSRHEAGRRARPPGAPLPGQKRGQTP